MNEFDPILRIQELCSERNWSYYQLAKVSGLTYSTLSTMINKHNMPSISIAEFFDQGKHYNGLTQEQVQCLELFTTLSQDEKRLAIAYMKGLAHQL